MRLPGNSIPGHASHWASNARPSCLHQTLSISGSITLRFLHLVIETAISLKYHAIKQLFGPWINGGYRTPKIHSRAGCLQGLTGCADSPKLHYLLQMKHARDPGFERMLHDKAPIGFFGLIFMGEPWW